MEHCPDPAPGRNSACLGILGIDHVRLSYQYMNDRDIDGYGSLFDTDVVLRYPGAQPVVGRVALEEFRRGKPPNGHYSLNDLFCSGDQVVALGKYIPASTETTVVEFAEVFTVADSGLLGAQTSYHFVAPADGC